jgi:hypothetical protein
MKSEQATMPTKVWKIRGFDAATLTFEASIPEGSLSEKEVVTMLQRLAARHLTDGEVVSGSLRHGMAGYRHDFEIERASGGAFCLTTNGSGAHYTATIEESAT